MAQKYVLQNALYTTFKYKIKFLFSVIVPLIKKYNIVKYNITLLQISLENKFFSHITIPY